MHYVKILLQVQKETARRATSTLRMVARAFVSEKTRPRQKLPLGRKVGAKKGAFPFYLVPSRAMSDDICALTDVTSVPGVHGAPYLAVSADKAAGGPSRLPQSVCKSERTDRTGSVRPRV